MQITHHTQLLNALIEKYGYRSYLEIGVQNPANNFDKVKCRIKVGVDPEVEDDTRLISTMTSDEFFKKAIETDALPFDLIFIDGLHHADQVKRDFENAMRCLSPNGRIVIHDVLPENEQGTLVPRQTKQWWGDVYKWAMTIYEYNGIAYKTFNIDNGCMVVWKNPEIKAYPPSFTPKWTWHSHRHNLHLLNVTDEVTI